MGKETVKVKTTARRRGKRLSKRMYDEPVEKSVLAVWKFFHRVCGKRLVPMIRANLKALAAEFIIPREAQEKLARASRSTVERMLGRERKRRNARGTSPAPSSNSTSPSEPSGIGKTKNPAFAR
ncbi:MAG: hypothetical protein LBH51_04375 [Treponema sp.]|nr:hypothetical protein [Treponema sp.]